MATKLNTYAESTDGKIFGIDLNEAGPQGLSFDRIDPDTGAKGYARRERLASGDVLTRIYLDEDNRIILLERYWVGFPRQDLLAIADAQRKFFLNHYSLKLTTLTDRLGQSRLLSKTDYLAALKSESLHCDNKCLRLVPSDKGISKVITQAVESGYYLESEKNRFYSVSLQTRYLKTYQDNKLKKYERMGGQ